MVVISVDEHGAYLMNTRYMSVAFLSNLLFFGIATAATLYVVADSWKYGFFFTPVPAVLTALLLMFGGAAVTAARCLKHGSMAACDSSINLPRSAEYAIRGAAVLLPLPIVMYALAAFCINNYHPSSFAMVAPAAVFTKWEQIAFGPKRADDTLSKLTDIYRSSGQLAIAERYADLAVSNISSVPFPFKAKVYRERLVDRLAQLATIYERQGKYVPALRTWQRRHIAIHSMGAPDGHTRMLCGVTLAKEAYNAHMLVADCRADTLYRLAERDLSAGLVSIGHMQSASGQQFPIPEVSPQRTKGVPIFSNHERILLSSMPVEFARASFSDKINLYNPNLTPQVFEPVAEVNFVTPAEYEALINGTSGIKK